MMKYKIKFHKVAADTAYKQSFLSDYKKFNIGSVIVLKNKIVSVGFNKDKTHPDSPDEYKMIHAEFDAIHKCDFDISGASIYICRLKKNGQHGLAKPCKNCLNLIKQKKIKYVWYSDEGLGQPWTLLEI